MNRIIICASILVSIMIICIVSNRRVDYLNKILIEKINSAESFVKDEDLDKAKEAVDDLIKYWERYYDSTSYLIHNDQLHELSYSIASLNAYLEFNDDQFFTECEVIRNGLELIYEDETITFKSVF